MPELDPPGHEEVWETLTGEPPGSRNWRRFIDGISDLQRECHRLGLQRQIPIWWWMTPSEQLGVRLQEAYFNHPQGTPRSNGALMNYVQIVISNNITWARDWTNRHRPMHQGPHTEPISSLEEEFFRGHPEIPPATETPLERTARQNQEAGWTSPPDPGPIGVVPASIVHTDDQPVVLGGDQTRPLTQSVQEYRNRRWHRDALPVTQEGNHPDWTDIQVRSRVNREDWPQWVQDRYL